MRIAVCCLRLAVPKQSPYDRQREAMTDADARRGMTEVMNSNAVEFSSPAQPFPRLRQVYERFARQPAFDDESAGRGFRPHREVAQYHQGGIAQKEGFRAGLAVGQDDAVTVPVNPVPTSLQHLVHPRAGQQQQFDRSCRINAVGTVGCEFVKRPTEPAQFVIA